MTCIHPYNIASRTILRLARLLLELVGRLAVGVGVVVGRLLLPQDAAATGGRRKVVDRRVLAFVQLKKKVVFERSRSKSSPLEQTRLNPANPVEITGFTRG